MIISEEIRDVKLEQHYKSTKLNGIYAFKMLHSNKRVHIFLKPTWLYSSKECLQEAIKKP